MYKYWGNHKGLPLRKFKYAGVPLVGAPDLIKKKNMQKIIQDYTKEELAEKIKPAFRAKRSTTGSTTSMPPLS